MPIVLRADPPRRSADIPDQAVTPSIARRVPRDHAFQSHQHSPS